MKKKKFNPKVTRRQVLKAGMVGGAGLMLPLRFLPAKAFARRLHRWSMLFSTGCLHQGRLVLPEFTAEIRNCCARCANAGL